MTFNPEFDLYFKFLASANLKRCNINAMMFKKPAINQKGMGPESFDDSK